VINPALPGHWRSLEFSFSFKGTQYQVAITPGKVIISGKDEGKGKIKVHLCGEETELPNGGQIERDY
jgi:trehalose/maltose hydrolase-like predicted phosphorylase